MTELIGVFGGTFDPVHRGHIEIANIVTKRLNLSRVLFIPCKVPLLKDKAQASTHDRVAMLETAIKPYPKFFIDKRELERETPSFMVETLTSLKQDYPDATLCLILGEDAFSQLPNWHQWEKLLSLSHLIVINRKQAAPITDTNFLHLIAESEIEKSSWLMQKTHGYILKLMLPPIITSSTAIRAGTQAGHNMQSLLPVDIWDYIKQHKLYGYNA